MLFEILFDIIGSLLRPFFSLIGAVIIPVTIIGLVYLFVHLLFEYTSFRPNQKSDYDDRYKNPSRPDAYRSSDSIIRCSTCNHSIRSNSEGADLYCQKHQVDVLGHYVCNNYHSVLLDP